ncbi:hypothetical protein K432DRAFT_381029 [Lepidopterella palustris CBS 459.81]|uniref:F-box domain-containing protein n=1 Tax=Lepidopterella palustris CBS 459.81 TaxID=1314670 RepID=A0A8E2EDD0_9PEZI|nr:hypothetical protein K432DRAFT_381029 [Lepidopterella palustris CBS 459.81]
MPKLLDLPIELLCNVVDGVDDRTSLLKLCLVCKTLLAMSQPVLFNSFRKAGERPEYGNQSYTCYGPAPKARLISFVRTIIERPDLALQVKWVDVETFDDDINPEDEFEEPPSEEDMEIFYDAVRQLDVKKRYPWIRALTELRAIVFIALLIIQTPNMEDFEFILTYKPISLLSGLARRTANGVPSNAFKSLKKLTVTHFDAAGGFNLQQIARLLSLPSLQSLFTKHCLGDNVVDLGDFGSFECEPGTLNLSTLVFDDSSIDATCLHTLIAACKSLKQFEYQSMLFHEMSDVDQFTPSEMYSALKCQKSSLEMLTLDFTEHEYDQLEGDWRGEDPIIGDLREFTNLKHLRVDQSYLEDREDLTVLPQSLESLTLQHCQGPISKTVADLVVLSKTALPSLRKLHIIGKLNVVLGLPKNISRDDSAFIKACEQLKGLVAGSAIDLLHDEEFWILGHRSAL